MREDAQPPSTDPSAQVPFTLGLGTLAITHAFIDMVLNILPPILPLVVRELGISLGMAGLLISLRSLATGLAQPLYGHLVDGYGRGWFLPLTVLWTGIFAALFGFSGSYGWLMALAIASGIGGGVYHPVAAIMAKRVARSGGAGSFSIFSLGGTVGMALAPLLAVGLTQLFGLAGLAGIGVLACLVALACVGVRLHRLPVRTRDVGSKVAAHADVSPKSSHSGSPSELRNITYLTAGLWARVTAHASLASFLPLYYVLQGHSEAYGGMVLTLYLGVGSASAVAFGFLSDRFGRRPVTLTTQFLAPPSILLFLLTTGPLSLFFLALASVSLYATVSSGVVYAQELFPSRPGVAAGLIMGTVWALGNLGVVPIGILSDTIGLQAALRWAALLPLLGAPLLWLLPETHVNRRTTTDTSSIQA